MFAACLLLAAVLAPQRPSTDSTTVLAGVVVSAVGRPVTGANVFIERTLEGTSTDSEGRFRLRTTSRGAVVVIARSIGFRAARQTVELPTTDTLRLVLSPAEVALNTVRVEAGRHVAGSEQRATMTALEVSSIPGARGDIARAFQTLPGVQNVDEGTGMFVRGGDSPETKVFLNGAELVDPQRLETPLGSVAATVDPFLLDGIAFSTGAFSTRYGNALSAIAELRTAARPRVRRMTAHVSLASVSARFAQPVGSRLGVHGTVNLSDSRAVVALNGSPRRYVRAPHGHTASASAVWNYRPNAELKLFALHRRSALAVWSDVAAYSGVSRLDESNAALLLTWAEQFGAASVQGGASVQRFERAEEFASLDLVNGRWSPQGFVSIEAPVGTNLRLRAGLDADGAVSSIRGTVPLRADDAPDGAARTIDRSVRGDRVGAYAESEYSTGERLRVRAGVRSDQSDLTGERTADPRASALYLLGGSFVAVVAGGAFHQLPDPLALALDETRRTVESMQGRQVTAGISAGSEARMLRAEVYHRTFADLTQITRDRRVASNGTGHARGVDVFARGAFPAGTEWRAVYSHVRALRTDPLSGRLARAPFDVTHSALLVVERGMTDQLSVGAGFRAATGRPYTRIDSGRTDAQGRWEAVYARPYEARLPSFRRLDLSASWLQPLDAGALLVAYLSVSNVTDRRNVAGYRYSADFRTATPIVNTVGRGVFFGASYTR